MSVFLSKKAHVAYLIKIGVIKIPVLAQDDGETQPLTVLRGTNNDNDNNKTTPKRRKAVTKSD